MRESTLVRAIIKAVKEKYPTAYIRKISDRHRRGIPDLIILFQRAESLQLVGTLFVEAKTIYGRAPALQCEEANAIMRAGGRHIFATSPAEVLNELEAIGAIVQ